MSKKLSNYFSAIVLLLIINPLFVNAQDFSFGVIADIQYADKGNSTTRFYRKSLSKLDTCVANLNKEKIAFTVVFGDLVDEGPKDLSPIIKKLDDLNGKYKNVLGNHDYVGVSNKEELFKMFNMPAPYYSFKKNKWSFIVLNTNEVSKYGANENSTAYKEWEILADTLKKSGRKNVEPWNGGISKQQMSWLENELKKAKKDGNKVMIYSHHPLFPETGYEALNNREILTVIDKYSNVKFIMAGHHHKGGFAMYKKIPVITLEGMVETEKENAYGVVDVYKDKIVIKGKGRLTSRTLFF